MGPEQLPGGRPPFVRECGGAGERPGGAEVDGDARALAVGQQATHGLSAGGGLGQTVHDGNGFDSHIRTREEEQQGQQVVGAGVGVDNDRADSLPAEAQG